MTLKLFYVIKNFRYLILIFLLSIKLGIHYITVEYMKKINAIEPHGHSMSFQKSLIFFDKAEIEKTLAGLTTEIIPPTSFYVTIFLPGLAAAHEDEEIYKNLLYDEIIPLGCTRINPLRNPEVRQKNMKLLLGKPCTKLGYEII